MKKKVKFRGVKKRDMITRLEISGFKTFHDFSITLSPLVLIAGVNAAGKSNLFDVIQLLSRLADTDIRSAFGDLRGEAFELFEQQPDGSYVPEMRFGVDMLVDRKVRDNWGSEAELKYTRLRYEVVIGREKDKRGVDRLFIRHESLVPIQRGEDKWYKNYIGASDEYWLPKVTGGRVPFVSTEQKGNVTTINLHQDKGSRGRPRPAADLESTMLSSVTNTEFPHALAAREEMRKWHFLQLNPVKLRIPSDKFTAREIMAPDGTDLSATLFRMKTEDPLVLQDISREMANLISGVKSIDVAEDTVGRRYVIQVAMDDGRNFSSQVLSEGTLRLLALATLKYDDRYSGVLCFEEPENGVHPSRLKRVLSLMQDLATDFREHRGFPLRQVIMNTHSPLLVGQLNEILNQQTLIGGDRASSIFFAKMVTAIKDGKKLNRTRMTPIVKPGKQAYLYDEKGTPAERQLSMLELKNYLESVEFDISPSQANEPAV